MYWPWRFAPYGCRGITRNPLGRTYRLGYSWLWKPPEVVAASDLSATILQVAACGFVSAAVFLLIVRWKRT